MAADRLVVGPWRDPDREVRLRVLGWDVVERISDQFIERPRSPGMVWSYLWRIGPRVTARKILSRLRETSRNRKVAALAVARVQEAPASSAYAPGDLVACFLTSWGEGTDACVDVDLVRPAAMFSGSASEHSGTGAPSPGGTVSNGPAAPREPVHHPFARWAGWSPFAGVPLDRAEIDQAFESARPAIVALLAETGPTSAPTPPRPSLPTRRPRSGPGRRAGRPTATLFGLGNYAKTQLLPVVARKLDLATIHEIDPHQASSAARWNVTIDTSPWPRDDERYDVWFVAGYHATHAPIALTALERGGIVVIEKPLATTRDHYHRLAERIGRSGRFFAGFHKRYSPMARWVERDLGAPGTAPVDMHAVVYEIPLPGRHWYNWPASGSRIVSNGCHWLDYFCFVNGYPEITGYEVDALRGRDLLVSVRAANGAVLTLVLTERGSARLGVRDVIELRAHDVTIRMIDGHEYRAESSKRVLARRRINPVDAYTKMYASICDAVIEGGPGDPPESLRSTALMLDLEDELRRRRSAAVGGQG